MVLNLIRLYIQKAEPLIKRLCNVEYVLIDELLENLQHQIPPPVWVAEIKEFALRYECDRVFMV